MSDITAGFILGLVSGIAIAFLAWNICQDVEHSEAIKAGVAQYVVNPQTGETQFVYLTKPEAKQ